MTNQTHTADTLAALPDAELDALAAKARYPETFSVTLGLSGSNLWQPTRDANQALRLLAWVIGRGWRFAIEADRDGSMIDFVQMDQVLWHWQRVDGFTPRAITIAFILAMQEVHNG